MALTDKLTAIADAIRGKTGGTEEMTLDQMATEINGIEAGGGDGRVETCAVTIESSASIQRYAATKFVDGAITASVENAWLASSLTIENVVCGSVLMIMVMNSSPSITTNNATLIRQEMLTEEGVAFAYFSVP